MLRMISTNFSGDRLEHPIGRHEYGPCQGVKSEPIDIFHIEKMVWPGSRSERPGVVKEEKLHS